MPIKMHEESGGRMLVVQVSGELAAADFDCFVPEFERLAELHGALRVLFDMTGIDRWDVGAAWEDVKFGVFHFNDIERLAMVGDQQWQHDMAMFCKPFTAATVRYFDLADADQAKLWLAQAWRLDPVPTLLDAQRLADTARRLVADDKGLLAMDESTTTCHRRFAKYDIPQTPEARRAYRELIVSTPGLGDSISGAILCDETLRGQTQAGTPFAQFLTEAGIVPGIKVDLGAKELAGHHGELITEGLDGLRDRLAEYARLGACFAKWRAVLTVGEGLPSRGCIEANAHALARYAALCQEVGLLPIVEPDVLTDGNHSLARCGEVTEAVLRAVFEQLYAQHVMPEGMILKPNMVLPGAGCTEEPGVGEIAEATIGCLRRAVPAAVPGIAFLSGGQAPELASARLNEMNTRFRSRLPWALAFSFARAIQRPALALWRGEPAQVPAAQQALLHRARCNQAARRGDYTPAMEAAAE